jgi:hypothetical protein
MTEARWYQVPMYWLLNALNLLDAVLTTLAIRVGVATEGNPVVTWMGIPGKLVLVAVAGAFLAHVRPGALVVPVVAMGAVVVWTAVGVAVLL